jgi:oxygen-independent coproporphyrinogen III oxidase
MPGLYLHIPFCKQACHYCNFHFSTNLSQKEAMVEAICRELILQKNYLDGAQLDTIYFGGGTPSLLTIKELDKIFLTIRQNFDWHPDAEITLEANPDDLDLEKINDLKNHTPINRFSIGIQSFFEEDLRWMNRAHSANEARKCLENALAVGFNNLSIDLIYGSPTTTSAMWDANLDIAFSYPIPHLSCYALTVETGTALAHFVKKKQFAPPDDDATIQQFDRLIERSSTNGFEHYEISNFAKTDFRARHNSNYWLGEPYLGVGPAAHSFNKQTRHGNIANNAAYLKNLGSQKLAFELEILTPTIRYNEYILTRLRTVWGCRVVDIAAIGADFVPHFLTEIAPFLADESVILVDDLYFLSKKGKFLADRIAMELFA